MFKIKPTTQTYSDPVSSIFKPGVPLGREYAVGDMCLLHDEITGSKTFLNSKILREAILASIDFVQEILELEIKDVRPKEVTKEVPKKKETPTVIDEEPLKSTEVDTSEEKNKGEPNDNLSDGAEVEAVPTQTVVEEIIGEPKKKSIKK